MTPSRPDHRRPRRTPSTPLSIAASVALSACLLGTTSVAAHAEGRADAATAAPAQDATSAPALPTPTPSIAPEDAAPSAGPAAPEAAASAAPGATPDSPDAAPAPASPAPTPETTPPAADLAPTADPAPAPAPAAAAADIMTTPTVAAAPPAPAAAPAPSPTPAAPVVLPTPVDDAPAAATETPVAAAQQQPAPPASAPTTGDSLVTATARGTFVLGPGEKPTVGTKVKWSITFQNNGTTTADVYGTTFSIPAGQSRNGRDDAKEQTVTQADLNAGVMRYANSWGIVTPAGVFWIPVRAELPIPAENPALEVVYTPTFERTPGQPVVIGTVVDSTVTVTNRGEVTLHDITFTGTPPFSLAPGQRAVLAVRDKVDQLDVLAGEYHREGGVVSARTPRGAVYQTTASVRLPFPKPDAPGAPSTATPAPAPGAGAGGSPASGTTDESWRFRGEFVLQPGEQVKAGTKVRWTSTLTNTGPDDLRDLVAVRVGAAPGSPGSTSEKLAVLAKGRTAQLHLESTVTEDDLASGLAHIVVDATAVTGGKTNTVRSGATLAIPAEHPLLAVTTTTAPKLGPGAPLVAGTVLDTTFTIVNRGDVVLTDVRLNSLAPFTLAPGESAVRVLSGPLPARDVEAGEYRRTANVTARTPRGVQYISPDIVVALPIPKSTPAPPAPTGTPAAPTPTSTVPAPAPTGTPTTPAPTGAPSTPAPVPPTPAATGDHLVSATAKGTLELKPGEKPTIGTKVTWIVTFRNDGPVAVQVSGSGLTIPPGQSRAGRDVTLSRTVTQADLEAGKVSYALTWDLSSTQGRFSLPVVGELALPGGPSAPVEHPALEVAYAPSFRLAPGAPVALGTVVDATVTLTNRGDVALNDIRLAGLPPFSLAPGQVSVQRLSDAITLSDLNAGEYRRVGGYATARTPQGAEYRSTPATIVLAIPKPAPTGTTPGSTGGTVPTGTPATPATTGTPATPATTGTVPAPAPTGTPATPAPTGTVPAPAPTGTPATPAPTGAPAAPATTGTVPAPAPTGTPATPAITGTVPAPAPTGTPGTTAPTGTVPVPAPTGTPATPATTGTVPAPAPTATPATPAPTGAPATPAPTGTVPAPTPTGTPATPATTGTPATPASTGTVPAPAPTGAPTAPAATGTPATPSPTGAPSTPATTGTVPAPAPTGTPVTPATTGTVPTPAPTGTPATPATTGAPSTPAPTGTVPAPAPTGTPVTPAPTGTPTTPAPTGSPAAPAPTETPATPAPTGTPSTPVPTGTPNPGTNTTGGGTGAPGTGTTGTGTPATGTPGPDGTSTSGTGTTGTRPSTAGPRPTGSGTPATGTTGTRPTITDVTATGAPGAVGPDVVTTTGTTATGTTATGTTASSGATTASAGTTDARTTVRGTTGTTGTTGSTPSGVVSGTNGSGATGSGVTGTRPTKDVSGARLAETGVDAASALPAAGILGLLGALGVLLGRRRRRDRPAD
ncbi:LPXTG-motif cell wall-anchored protein [Rathayibacter sp. PhB93]|uniref:LPXTG cell wall anchor domain-containing protein n=1 Tax=unclassified Rathayibacter TaxID=2609250 RepID=UPI000FA42C44|nr:MULTISPECIES: LPXTG cell wall anchor domain-containing protein [unclassified Rathayibacter]ROQ04589.1 LPXTG-motif cell wall-anchored protein [Rathayibacter sp. PhB93]TDQ13427.1 LPXTG-motif cell wall-anchored protein [Rathayibacter sp. PhB1]